MLSPSSYNKESLLQVQDLVYFFSRQRQLYIDVFLFQAKTIVHRCISFPGPRLSESSVFLLQVQDYRKVVYFIFIKNKANCGNVM